MIEIGWEDKIKDLGVKVGFCNNKVRLWNGYRKEGSLGRWVIEIKIVDWLLVLML